MADLRDLIEIDVTGDRTTLAEGFTDAQRAATIRDAVKRAVGLVEERNRAQAQAGRLRAERALLLAFARNDLTGLSATALVIGAITGTNPTWEPRDGGDLSRCERAYGAAPAHLQPYMRTWIEQWRRDLDA